MVSTLLMSLHAKPKSSIGGADKGPSDWITVYGPFIQNLEASFKTIHVPYSSQWITDSLKSGDMGFWFQGKENSKEKC